jgi:two-component system, cell cycle sensor histidine kinase and response regulator CckA
VVDRSRQTSEISILVVEDEEQVRTLVVRLLEKRGYRVLQAENGRKALAIAGPEINRISLVITDIVMPEMGGAPLVLEMRALNPALRFLCMTGYSKEEVLSGNGLDEAAFIEKPFTPNDLLDKVEEILNSR